jgi:putative membrane protein
LSPPVAGERVNEVFEMMYWGNGMGGWGYVLMTVSMLLFWGLLLAGVVLLVRYVGSDRRPPAPPPTGPDPRTVLAERFARGDINEDDYRQRLKVLSSI